MNDGLLTEHGTHAELMQAKGEYFNLVASQNHFHGKDNTEDANVDDEKDERRDSLYSEHDSNIG